jgi:hypothetical protein
MASACYPPIADGYLYGSIFELGMESSKPSASSNTQPLGLTACLKPSEVEAPASMLTDDCQFRLAPPMGQLHWKEHHLYDCYPNIVLYAS